MVTELENGLRASIVMLDAESLRTGVWARGAADLLQRHRGRLELVVGSVAMRLLGGGELLEILESVSPRVPLLLASARWYGLAFGRIGAEPDELPLVPFDPDWVRAHLDELQRLSDAA